MATEAAVQVIPSSADMPGMSVVTASRSQNAPRSGLIYNPETLAAAEPVWFHPMPDGNYLALFSRRLTGATLAGSTIDNVLLFNGYTVDTDPSWAVVGPKTGEVQPVALIPSEQPGIRTLVAAASRGNYLFTLNRYQRAGDDTVHSLLQNFRVTSQRGITLLGEELVPGDFALGLYCDHRYLWLTGDDGDGYLSLARKNWGRIGTDEDANPTMNWQFWGAGSWNSDINLLSAIIDQYGAKLPADGPCSLSRYRDSYYLMSATKTVYPPTIPDSNARLSMAVSPDDSTLYVADYLANKISVISTATKTITATITTPSGPWTMIVHPSGNKLYVANRTDNSISVIDTEKRKIAATITISNAGDMVFNLDATKLYMVSPAQNSVVVVDTVTNKISDTIAVGQKPSGIALSPNGNRLYVANTESHTVSIINTATNKVINNASVGLRNIPTVLAATSSKVYIGGTGAIYSLSTAVNRVTSGYDIPNIGLSMTVSPNGSTLYLANTLDSISVITAATGAVTKTIATGTDLGSVQISLNPNGTRIYATNTHDKTVTFIDTATKSSTGVVLLSSGAAPTTSSLMNPIVDQINAILNGVINGFIAITSSTVAILTNLLDEAVSTVTGQSGVVNSTVKGLVQQLLQSLTGSSTVVTDPATIIESIIRGIAAIPGVGGVITLAENYLQGTINTILGLATDVITLNPTKLLEDIIRAITGITTGTGNSGGGSSDIVTVGTGQASLSPEPSWDSVVYTSRKVQQIWTRHGFTYPIAATTTTYQDGGGYLQGQIPLTPGYGVTPTSAEVTFLDEFSDHIQVFTGTSPHTVILPPTAQVTGTTVSTEGVILVPDTPTSFAPSLSIADATITEGNLGPRNVTFRVTLSSATSKTVTVVYATVNDTATAGEDYTAATGTVTFAPGIVSQQVTTTISGDRTYETNETFTVTLSAPTNATIDDDTALCTIVNDDQSTLIESLLVDFQNIINGITSGAINVGSAIVTAVTTILEQSARTLTGVVGDTGTLVASLVDQFLSFVSGGTVDLGDYPSPQALLADILNQITGGTGEIGSTVVDLAGQLFTIVSGTGSAVVDGVVTIFQDLIGSIFGLFGGSPFSLMSASAELMSASEDITEPVVYMPYTIHNQSTSDIVVMTASRDKGVTVRRGSGITFTPYTSTPLLLKDWSWDYAAERSPRPRQGFPFVTTRKLNINTYQITVTGSPTSGVFRLIHDGHVSEKVTISQTPSTTRDNISVAIASMGSVVNYTVTADSATQFTVVILEDSSVLDVYSYRLLNGTSPKVEVTQEDSDSTLLTRWAIFEPNPKPAAVSGKAKDAAIPRRPSTTETPLGLAEIMAQFAKVITVVSGGVVAVGAGVIATVTDIISESVYLITGQRVTDTTAASDQVTDFLQKLASGDGVSTDAGTAFENVLRQITGGTGLTNLPAVPAPLDFVNAAVDAVEETIQTLAEWLQKILNAITGN